ncbi:MAG TPA: Os1348 family NHLP clan protein, partial [Kofleriaceae bacterium]|nr:Os1348 family NHLP clan protein [Kofleriaceae bacterium]
MVGFQDAFVALVADAALRRRFVADPEAALDGYALDARERAALRGIPVETLDRFARSLIAKRWHELARVVPLTRRVSPRLRTHHRMWALEHPARTRDTVLPPGVAEALRAEAALRDALADEGEAPYAADLWMLEVRRA